VFRAKHSWSVPKIVQINQRVLKMWAIKQGGPTFSGPPNSDSSRRLPDVDLPDAAAPVAEDLEPIVSGLVLCRRRWSSVSWPNNMAESDMLPSSPAGVPSTAAAAVVVPLGAVVVGGTSAEEW